MYSVRFIVFKTSFNNMSVISCRSVLLVETIRVPGENHWPVAYHWQTLSHNAVSDKPYHEWDSYSQLWWWEALIAQVVVNPTTIRSQQWCPSINSDKGSLHRIFVLYWILSFRLYVETLYLKHLMFTISLYKIYI
jgi:hypothetical protein